MDDRTSKGEGEIQGILKHPQLFGQILLNDEKAVFLDNGHAPSGSM